MRLAPHHHALYASGIFSRCAFTCAAMALICATFMLTACRSNSAAAKPPAEPSDRPDPGYVRRAGYNTVIVFVHGIFGNAKTTWTNAQTGAYWPSLLKDDDHFKATDIYVHSFASPYLSRAYPIDDLIEDMRITFEKDQVMQHNEVIFLCHSMGGLIVRGFLKRYQALYASKVPLIFFYSTPTDGSHITNLAKFLSRNPQLRGMLPVGSNEYLRAMQKDWRAIPARIYSRCAYETKDTYGINIVDESSATTLCDGPVDPLPFDHIDIVKPAKIDDVRYSQFQLAFSNRPGVPLTATIAKAQVTATVDCGRTSEQTVEIRFPYALRPEQRVADAIIAVEGGRNLKEQFAYKLDVSQEVASVHYRLVGLDRDTAGTCSASGSATIAANFIVNQPAQ
jgi:pimeloyl-ACP methyl ester carboxylesterase